MTLDATPVNDRPPAEAEPVTEQAATPDVPDATEDQVRGALRIIGKMTHRAAGDERFPEHWSFTDPELDALTPPATAVVNRIPALRSAVARSDYGLLAAGLFGWGARNVELSHQIAEREAELVGEPADVTPPGFISPLGPLYEGADDE